MFAMFFLSSLLREFFTRQRANTLLLFLVIISFPAGNGEGISDELVVKDKRDISGRA